MATFLADYPGELDADQGEDQQRDGGSHDPARDEEVTRHAGDALPAPFRPLLAFFRPAIDPSCRYFRITLLQEPFRQQRR